MSEQVDSRIRTFRELLNEYSEHTAIDWLRDVFIEAERESAECQRLRTSVSALREELERIRHL